MNCSLVLYPETAMGEAPFIFEDAASSQKDPGNGNFCYSCLPSLVCQAELGEYYVVSPFPLMPGYQEDLSSHSPLRAKS